MPNLLSTICMMVLSVSNCFLAFYSSLGGALSSPLAKAAGCSGPAWACTASDC